MCVYVKMKRPKGNMEFSTLKKVVDESRGRSKTSYLHQIGEPLLHKGIIEMINYVADAGIRTSISTNGMILEGEWHKKICDSKLDELTIAMDGMTKETYEHYRVGGDFERVMNNLDNFLKFRKEYGRGPRVEAQIIQMKENDGDIKSFDEKYGPLTEGIGVVRIKPYSRFAGYVDDHGNVQTQPLRFNCSKVKSHITIHWNGDVVICCRDFAGFTKVGNVHEQSVEEIWHSDTYQEYRRQHEQQDFAGNLLCKDC